MLPQKDWARKKKGIEGRSTPASTAAEMGVDYYKILGVDRGAKDDDINKAYGNIAVRWTAGNKETGADIKQISEAYEVLSDPRKRAVYDQYGEEGLRGQVPPGGGSAFFSGGGGPSSFRFSRRSAEDIFAGYFGFRPFGGMVDGMRKGAATKARQPRKATLIEKRLLCSLEDLYKGAVKKMKISREMLDDGGKTKMVEETLAINVEPGSTKGTKITFAGERGEAPHIVPADIVFIVSERPHDVYRREGDDLIATKEISLVEALTTYTASLTTLDGRSLAVPIDNVIHPDYEEVVAREGMPAVKDPSCKGNLRIRFGIKFPARLTAEQKAGIKELLDSVD